MNQMQHPRKQGHFIRSRPQVSRGTTRSERNSSNNNGSLSLKKKLESISIPNEQDNLQKYFNHNKRRTYFKSVIDDYFQVGSKKSFLSLDISADIPNPLRAPASSQSKRCRKVENINLKNIKLKSRLSMMDFSAITDIKSLPIIEQDKRTHKRPVSQHKISSIVAVDRDIEDSLYLQSNISFLQNSNANIQKQTVDQFQNYKLITLRKGSKKFGKTKVFNSNDNPQLIRQLTAKRLGMDLLWTQSINSSKSIEYPVYKTLRQLCYSIVQDKKGDEPLILIYPTPYYYGLFANANEELIDIVISLVRGIIKGKGNIANNQIHIQNIVKIKQKRFVLADWGCGAFRESMIIQGRTFSKDLMPFCKEANKWIATPEYLSPQLLKAVQVGYYDQLWKQKGGLAACDVWSVGCLIYELITLVPLTSPYFCVIKGKEQRKRGYFTNKGRSIQKILLKQRNFKGVAIRSIKQELRGRKQLKINEKIIQILPRMLEESVENRITAQEILARLS